MTKTRSEYLKLWKSAGGKTFGPRVEHWCIEEDKVMDFIDAVRSDGAEPKPPSKSDDGDLVGRLRQEVTVGSGQVTPIRLEAAAEIERLRSLLSGERCDGCGRVYRVIYRVSNDVWAKIAPHKEHLGPYPEHQLGGLLCPDCAAAAAQKIGLMLRFEASASGWGDETDANGEGR